MKPIEWRRICLVVVVYLCALCLLSNGLRVEDTKAPETAVPTVEQEQDSRGDRKQKADRQRATNSNNPPPQPSNNNRHQVTTTETHLDGSGGIYNPDDLQMGCTELRSKRYISDGFCTSMRPITEVVCAGECLPVDNGQLPFYAQYMKVWSREKTREYRCVNDVVRQKRVELRCDNNESRTYRIRTVRSCKCKKYNEKHNKSQLFDNQQSSTTRKSKSTETDRRSRKRRQKRRNNRQKRSDAEDIRTERIK